MKDEYVYCILEKEEDLIEYEKELYKSFTKNNPDNWLTENYIKIDNCRFKSKIPYSDQAVYAVKKNNIILLAGSINFNIKNKMQLEEIGFKIDKESGNDFCEGLLFYKNDSSSSEEDDFIYISSNFFKFINEDLRKKKIKFAYGTCSRSLKAMYSLMGFEEIDKKELNGEKKILMKINVV